MNPATGEVLTERHRVDTPSGGSPTDISREVAQMVAGIRAELAEKGILPLDAAPAVGVTLPGVVQHGVIRTAANIAPEWVDLDAEKLMSDATGVPCLVVNDADAAGVAETAFGAANGKPGVTMVLTFGTGIGTALIHDEVLVPNFELGHIELDGHAPYERYASPKNIEREGLTIQQWAERVARYVRHLEFVCRPDHFVIGGSISKAADEYLPLPGVEADVVPAHFRNNAGIVGAASLAAAAL